MLAHWEADGLPRLAHQVNDGVPRLAHQVNDRLLPSLPDPSALIWMMVTTCAEQNVAETQKAARSVSGLDMDERDERALVSFVLTVATLGTIGCNTNELCQER